jgi:hypothetical protein
VTASDDAPFGDFAGDGGWAATDGDSSVTLGGLFPFPIYVVNVKATSLGLYVKRVIFGKRKAATWANIYWRAISSRTRNGNP